MPADPLESRLGQHIRKYVKDRWQNETSHEYKFSGPVLPMLALPKRCDYIFISIDYAFYAIQGYIVKPRTCRMANEHKESLFIQTMFLCHITLLYAG